jgi:hypothetical protein
MWYVVLDANAVILDLRPSEDGWRCLLRAAGQGQVIIGVPEVVVDELLAHRTNRFQPDVADAIAALGAWRDGRAAPLVDKLLAGGAGFELLPYPDVSHRQVVARALARRRPFDEDGHDGYRDALIWETVLALARTLPHSRITLVSRNRKDFADDHGDALHPHLRADVGRASGTASIELVRDVARLVERLPA